MFTCRFYRSVRENHRMTNPSQDTSQSGRAVQDGIVESVRIQAQSVTDDATVDMKLVLKAQAGDTAAFGELIERHQRAVYGLVSRMVTQRDDVDDIAQDVFVSAWKAIGSFRRDAKFTTWLHTITVNTTLTRLKTMKNKTALSIDDPDTGLAASLHADESESPSESLQKSERDKAVRKAIETLPEKHKLVVVMHYFEHHTCEDIASILGCSVGTVWSRLHYACKILKNELRWLDQST